MLIQIVSYIPSGDKVEDDTVVVKTVETAFPDQRAYIPQPIEKMFYEDPLVEHVTVRRSNGKSVTFSRLIDAPPPLKSV